MISFFKKKIIWIDKLKFKNISIVLKSRCTNKKKHVKTHEKRQGRKQSSKIFLNNHHMPHQTSSTRNDYERKINYDWP